MQTAQFYSALSPAPLLLPEDQAFSPPPLQISRIPVPY